MNKTEEFDILIQRATCPVTKRMVNLEIDDHLIFRVEDDGVSWKFNNRHTGYTGITTEICRVESDGHKLDLVLKYSLDYNQRLKKSMVHVYELNKRKEVSQSRLIFPKIGRLRRSGMESEISEVPVLVVPFVHGVCLRENIKSLDDISSTCDWLDTNFVSCLEVLKELHSVPVDESAPAVSPDKVASVIISDKALEGRAYERILLKRFLHAIRDKRLECVKQEAIESVFHSSFVHGDCFPHNIVIDENGSAHLIDWETVEVGNSLQDLSQLVASVIIGFVTKGLEYKVVERLMKIVNETYMNHTMESLSFRIFLLKALVRFSPLTRKYFVVVPSKIESKLKYLKVLNTHYPFVLKRYYFFLQKIMKDSYENYL